MWRVGEASFNDLVKKNVKISKMVEVAKDAVQMGE